MKFSLSSIIIIEKLHFSNALTQKEIYKRSGIMQRILVLMVAQPDHHAIWKHENCEKFVQLVLFSNENIVRRAQKFSFP